jgi:hypothetical protein
MSTRSVREEVGQSPTQPNGYIILFQLRDLAGTLSDIQLRLDFLADSERLDDSEQVSTTWQTRCEETERSLKEAVNSAKWLRVQNEDLERRVNMHQLEIRCALDARDAAFKRLKHARRVIQDLLDERVSDWLLSTVHDRSTYLNVAGHDQSQGRQTHATGY